MKVKQTKSEYRAALYARNVALVRKYKEDKGCEECELSFPHYVLDTIPSVSALAGSRCSPDVLAEALNNSKVVCANCRRSIEWTKEQQTKK